MKDRSHDAIKLSLYKTQYISHNLGLQRQIAWAWECWLGQSDLHRKEKDNLPYLRETLLSEEDIVEWEVKVEKPSFVPVA